MIAFIAACYFALVICSSIKQLLFGTSYENSNQDNKCYFADGSLFQ